VFAFDLAPIVHGRLPTLPSDCDAPEAKPVPTIRQRDCAHRGPGGPPPASAGGSRASGSGSGGISDADGRHQRWAMRPAALRAAARPQVPRLQPDRAARHRTIDAAAPSVRHHRAIGAAARRGSV